MEMMTAAVDKDNEQASNTGNINHKLNKNDWKFNVHHDCENKGSKIHGIKNNGKRMKCDWNGNSVYLVVMVTMVHGKLK